MSIVSLLVTFVILALAVYVVRLLLPSLGLPDKVNSAIVVILVILALLWLLSGMTVIRLETR